MRSVAEISIRWHVLLEHLTTVDDLKKSTIRGDETSPCVSGLRSICWKVFLLLGDFDRARWEKTLSDSRSAYSALKEHFLRHINHSDEINSAVDPLTDDENSPWVALRQDEALRAEIWQDVERCMPDHDYFRIPSTQNTLLDILFIFCKLNQDTGYRQGMHELVAPILWVVERDAIEPRSLKRHRGSDGSDGILRGILDAGYIEHDAFTLFSLVMQTAKSYYELGDGARDRSSDLNSSTAHQQLSPIIERSQRIHQDYLNRVDPELAMHLTSIDILPQIFLIRWVRLLFGREFPFEELLPLWDALFAADASLSLVDFICVAMLLRVRWQLLEADYSGALTTLLRYPSAPGHRAVTFVHDALYLKDNLTISGGAQIISKYSGRSPAAKRQNKRAARFKKKARAENKITVPSQNQHPARPRSPLASSAGYIRRQGIDALLQDAARAVYLRSEKWGVNKAVRDAVDEMKKNMQGLQPGSTSPRPDGESARWSLDAGGYAAEPAAHDGRLMIEQLARRNKVLAMILEEALEELRRDDAQDGGGGGVDEQQGSRRETREAALAKVLSVRDCLENPSAPLPGKSQDEDPASVTDDTSAGADTEIATAIDVLAITAAVPSEAPRTPPSKPIDMESSNSTTAGASEAGGKKTSTEGSSSAYVTPTNTTPTNMTPTNTTPTQTQTQTQEPRPSLADSPFSWMLGDNSNDWRSSFSASFPTPATERRQGTFGGGGGGGTKPGFLFGIPAGDDDHHYHQTDSKGRPLEDKISLASLRSRTKEE